MQENFLPIFVFEETDWRGENLVKLTGSIRIRSLTLTGCGSHCNLEEWLKELEDPNLANEAKG